MVKKKTDSVGEANVLPVMNIMFLLIPALLLAMEVASFSAIAVSTPRAGPGTEPPADPSAKPFKMRVFIGSDGFRLDGGETNTAGNHIDLARKSPSSTHDGYDYAALEAKAREFKLAFPHESTVTLSAENDVSLDVLVKTMDAVRGHNCSLAQSLSRGAEVPANCLFWNPVIEAT